MGGLRSLCTQSFLVTTTENQEVMRFCKKATLTLALLFLCFPRLCAAEVTESQIKAVYLYNFLSFVTWETDETIRICVVGNKEVSNLLKQIRDQQSSPIGFTVDSYKNVKDTSDCHIAFLDYSEKKQLELFITDNIDSRSLTVSDLPGFSQKGGVIEFVKKDNNLKLQINIAHAKKKNIKISSRLLKVSEVVE